MKLRTIALVAAALLAVVLIALLFRGDDDRPQPTGRVGEPVLPAASVDRAAKFTLDNGTERSVLRRTDREWVVEQEYDFPVEQKFLTQFIFKLNELTLQRRVTDNPELFAELGVMLPSENGGQPEENKTGTEFIIHDEAGEPVVHYVFGNRRDQAAAGGGGPSGRGGQYMRDLANETVYVMSGAPRLLTKSQDWVRAVLLDFDAKKDLKWFSERRPGQGNTVVHRVGEPPEEVDFDTKVDWRVEGADPEARVNRRTVSEIAKGLGDLFLVRVSDPELSEAERGRSQLAELQVALFDGMLYDITIGEESDEEGFHHLTIEARPDPAADDPELEQRAEAYNRVYKGRVFRVHGWVADRILFERSALFQDS